MMFVFSFLSAQVRAKYLPLIQGIYTLLAVINNSMCSRFYFQKNEFALGTNKEDKMIVGGIHSWNPDCKFSHKPHVSIMKGDFQLIKIKLIQTNSNHRLKKNAFHSSNIPHTCISSTSSTSHGL